MAVSLLLDDGGDSSNGVRYAFVSSNINITIYRLILCGRQMQFL